MRHCCVLFSIIAGVFPGGWLTAQEPDFRIQTHYLASEYQEGTPAIRVLLPDAYDKKHVWRVLYVLPVETGTGTRWGDPMEEIKKHDLHNKHRLICVFPTFAQLPWYADHPNDKSVRQESFLLHAVLPFIEENLATSGERKNRLLVGFSKSGWGAFSLLLRNPDTFDKAAAWDAPLMMDAPGKYGSGPIFGSVENFRKFQISRLLRKQGKALKAAPRLISLGYYNFREDHLRVENLMKSLEIPFVHRDGPQRRHHWNSGWLPEAVELLVSNRKPY